MMIEKTKVFLSYSPPDSVFANKLSFALQLLGMSVFTDQSNLVSGIACANNNDLALSEADVIILVLSKDTKRGTWVPAEHQTILSNASSVISVLLDENGKNNWIWPLVSHRKTITVDSEMDFSEIGELIRSTLMDSAQDTSSSAAMIRNPRGQWPEAEARSFDPKYRSKLIKSLKELDPVIFDELQIARLPDENNSEEEWHENQIETRLLMLGRPVLDVYPGSTVIRLGDVVSKTWSERLKSAIPLFRPIVPAVGRIGVANFPGADWLGTGWLVRDNIVVTNRHVAAVFTERQGRKFRFIPDIDGVPTKTSIDFLEEFGSDSSRTFPVFEIVHIEKPSGHDIAFLRIEPVSGHDLPKPIPIESITASSGEQVAIIGYPARDPFFPDPTTMDRIFGGRYDKKRLAPGLVQEVTSTRLFHDCTTLGGNSGSVIVSIKSGKAVALHFAGTMFSKNHAVPIGIVHETLDAVLRSRPMSRSPETNESDKDRMNLQVAQNGTQATNVIEATIPIKIRIEIGETVNTGGISQTSTSAAQTSSSQSASAPSPRISPKVVAIDADDDMIELTEAKVSD